MKKKILHPASSPIINVPPEQDSEFDDEYAEEFDNEIDYFEDPFDDNDPGDGWPMLRGPTYNEMIKYPALAKAWAHLEKEYKMYEAIHKLTLGK